MSEVVYNSTRSIYSEMDCDIIVTGSYLGQTIKEKFFLPAGTVSYMATKDMCNEKRGNGSKIIDTITSIAKASQKIIISRDEITRAISGLIYSGIIGKCGLYNNGDINQYIPGRRIYYMDCGIASFIAAQTELADSSMQDFLMYRFINVI